MLTPDEIVEEEPKLLLQAKMMMPKIFFDKLDILIVDKIGKNISGPGMDPNITYTFRPNAAVDDGERAKRAKRVVVLRLTQETHGSALGIGLADMTTKKLFEQIDFDTTYPNGLTGTNTISSKIPMMFDSDKYAIKAAIKTIPLIPFNELRVVRIQDTLHISEIQISQALLKEAETMKNIKIITEVEPLPFDVKGDLAISF